MNFIKVNYRPKRIIFDGNSLMEVGGNNVRFDNQVSREAYSLLTGTRPPIFNYALGSTRTAGLTSVFPTKIGPNCAPGDILLFMEITNESRDGLSAQQMYDNYVAYAQQALSYGLIVIMGTCPAGKFTTDPSDTITRAQACNAMIRADHSWCTDIVDFGDIPNLNTEAGITNTTYYTTDQLHPNGTGYSLMASVAAAKIQTYI